MTDLVLAAQPLPLDPQQAREAMALYREMSSALLEPDDLQLIRSRSGTSQFPKRSAFQKLANAYRVSTEIVRRELTHDADGQLLRCDAIVRATHPDGRFAEGDGACSARESRFDRGGDKIDHDLPATAVTRATNRAISNLVAFGAVSAEEAEAGGGEAVREQNGTPAALPSWAQGVDDVPRVAGQLVDILGALGIQGGQADAAIDIGQAVHDACDKTFPRVAALVVEQIHGFLPSGSVDVRGDAPGATDAPEATDLPPTPQEG